MTEHLSFDDLMADPEGGVGRSLAAGRAFLSAAPHSELLGAVGAKVESLPQADYPSKQWFQKSYGRNAAPGDDFLVGSGLLYLTEGRRLMLDCTGGHYQMTWGYEHPALREALLDAIERHVVWDNHSNIPAAPVKRLSAKLIELANPGAAPATLLADDNRLNTVLLGTSTGSVACAAAMKMMLLNSQAKKAERGTPVFVMLDGNYHGTDLFAQRLRGMWPEYFANVEIVQVQPNASDELARVFGWYGARIAGFWAEPIMMNREAIVVRPEYLQLARRLCDETGALLAIDEIQTGFWFPEVLMTRQLGIEPDFIVLGKGMTAGFNPLSALVYKGKLDRLQQYDAISTNGNAALAAYMGLACIALIERHAECIGHVGAYYHRRMQEIAAEFPDIIVEARGAGQMSGLKFADVQDALGFHRAAVEAGLWLRVHAYHEGHSTVLTKFALPLDETVADFAIESYRRLLAAKTWRA
jgi:putrescine aminotransferase